MSDKILNFDELRMANVERCEALFHPLDDWTPADWAMAVTGELGELCNLLKKQKRGDVICAEDVKDEIADTLIYLDLLAARLGIDLGDAVINKFNKVSERVGSIITL